MPQKSRRFSPLIGLQIVSKRKTIHMFFLYEEKVYCFTLQMNGFSMKTSFFVMMVRNVVL